MPFDINQTLLVIKNKTKLIENHQGAQNETTMQQIEHIAVNLIVFDVLSDWTTAFMVCFILYFLKRSLCNLQHAVVRGFIIGLSYLV